MQHDSLKKLSRKSDTPAAIQSALNLWSALTCFSDDGSIEIDNSAAERAPRGVAIGRCNYLFAGADRGGERATAIHSLIGTAKLNGANLEVWLRNVLARIADHQVNLVDSATALATTVHVHCSPLSAPLRKSRNTVGTPARAGACSADPE